jgi:hypothetical protein
MLVSTFKTRIRQRHFQDNIIREEIMVEHRLTAWLRPLLQLVALAGVLSLAACGGGSGAPNNPYQPGPSAPPPIAVQPGQATVYSGVPATLTITSGTAPFSVFTDTSAVLPVAQSVSGNTIVLLANPVADDTPVRLTVQDATGQSLPVPVTVKPAPLLTSFTFVPSGGDCGTDLCSAQTGTARVVATGPASAPLVGRQIKFDVVYGPLFFPTSNPAQPQAQTVTVVTDNAGVAQVAVQAVANTTTQPAQIRATDLTTGNQQIANFTVVNNTTATQSPIVVVPNDAKITGPDKNTCSTGFRVDYYIYGGTPPYTVQSTFPQAVTLSTNVVPSSGSFFSATTNGFCVDPLTFTIADSAGKQTTAELTNEPGTEAPTPPAPPPALVLAPLSTTSTSCTGTTFNLVVAGGTGPYNVTANPGGPTIAPMVLDTPGSVAISGLVTGNGTYTFTVLDSGTPAGSQTATITCNKPTP